MSNKNVKYWSHEDLEWRNTGTDTTISEKDYEGVVWKSKYASKGRPEDTRALHRLGKWLTGLMKREDRYWKLSVVAQEFTQRGWTVGEVEEDILSLSKLVKKSGNATVASSIKSLLNVAVTCF